MTRFPVCHGICAALAAAALAGRAGEPAPQPLGRIRVDPGTVDRRQVPLSLPLDATRALPEQLVLQDAETGDLVPCRVEAGTPPVLHWIPAQPLAAGTAREFILREGTAAPKPAAAATARRTDTDLTLSVGDAPVLTYRFAPMPPPEGQSPLYTRSGFIHPLFSPAGETLTRIHPPDHYHHVGFWNPWTKTVFEGRHVDFWNLKEGQGTVRFIRFEETAEGPVYTGFRALQEHVDLSAPGGEKVALNEEWDVRVWNLGGYDGGFFLWDFRTTLRCASESPITFEKYRYGGGLGFRATESWNQGDYLTSEGKTRKDGHATRARWCLAYGPTEKGPAGILFMSHPENREHPEPLRIWNGQPEIFLNFCPIQQNPWTLEPGNDYVLRYRMYVYNGTADAETAERIWNDFANPPDVRFVPQTR